MTVIHTTDQDLVAGMLAGNEASFRAFFEAFFPRVYRFALPRLAGDAEATKEVVQSTLTKAVRHLPGYRGDAALFSWLCQICRRQIVDYVRANRHRAARIVLIEDSAELRAAIESIEAPSADEPAQGYDEAQTRRLIQAVLDRLPSRYGDVLEWKYVEGRSVEEIGQLLGVSYVAAQSMLARARVAFREGLETVFGATVRDVLVGMTGRHGS